MSELTAFVQLGFRHIVDVEALDHILFLVALAAIYRLRDARRAVGVITAFTIGHSITLALAVTHLVQLPPSLIEFLIPVTIVATGVENLAATSQLRAQYRGSQQRASRSGVYRAGLAGLFGLIHGAGFANYLNALFVDHVALPLFGFNLGIELGQILVLTLVAALLGGVDAIIRLARSESTVWPALRVRTAAVSLVVMAIGSAWAIERQPW